MKESEFMKKFKGGFKYSSHINKCVVDNCFNNAPNAVYDASKNFSRYACEEHLADLEGLSAYDSF